ncbi:MutS protein msh5 [Serendipita sp. 411]|nr:MutS protein msh5 [Serendipita sp. 411]
MSHIERTTVHWAKDHIVDEYSTNDKSASSNALDDDQESSEESQICMTIICNGGSVACSYFDPQTGILYIMEDTEENNHFDLTLRVLEHIGPNLVLTSTKSDELFMDFVRDQMERLDGALQIRPWKEFTVSHGLTRLYSLPLLAGALPDEDGDYLQEEAQDEPRNAYEFMAQRGKSTAHPTLTRWCAGVRLGNFTIDSTKAPLCFSAIGALLDYLMRARAVDGFTCDIEELEQVTKIEYVALNDVMQINNDALVSLQVFLSEKHASIYSNAFKEGLSIYGILNHTRTPLGSALLRQWLLRPSRSLTVIRHRHEAVSFFLKADNLAQSDILHKHIGGLKGAPIALKRLRNGRATLQNWKAMVQFWVSAALIKTDLLELFPNSCILASEELLNDIQSSTFVEVAEDINATIDWDESANLGRVTVKPLVDEELDTWKETLAGLDSLLSRVAEKVAEDVPPEEADLYGELSVIYFPQLGYLISIPVRQDCPIEEQRVGLQGWAFQFMTDESVYFKSNKMHEMDYHVGDLNTYIMDREIEILQSLQINVLGHSDFIMAICENAAILDCLLSYAAAARQYEWVRPVMCEESIIDIRGGRHPLQELIDEHFVSNDTYTFTGSRTRSREYSDTSDIDDTETVESSNTLEARQGHSITICTGANASGKSVYLKQCALIPYMAQVCRSL